MSQDITTDDVRSGNVLSQGFTIVVKPETSLNDKLDLAIHNAVKSTFVYSCDGLAKAAKLFYSIQT